MFLLDSDSTALIVFASDGGRLCNNGKTVTTRANPLYPTAEESYLQPELRSAAQVRIGADYLAATHSLTLSWPRLTLADFTALRAFFRDAARGMANRVTRFDALGAVSSGRFGQSTLDHTERPGETIEASIAWQEE